MRHMRMTGVSEETLTKAAQITSLKKEIRKLVALVVEHCVWHRKKRANSNKGYRVKM